MIHVDFICIVRPDKDITIENVEEFQAMLTSLSMRAGVHMVVDLSGVGMITTPGISALLETSRQIRDGGGAIAVARARTNVAEVLRRLRLENVLHVVPGMDEALNCVAVA
jgi:anti-anti-sigma factor